MKTVSVWRKKRPGTTKQPSNRNSIASTESLAATVNFMSTCTPRKGTARPRLVNLTKTQQQQKQTNNFSVCVSVGIY